MEESVCFLCSGPFEKHQKGWKRHPILTVTSPRSILKLLKPGTSLSQEEMKGKFLCHICLNDMIKTGVFQKKKREKKKICGAYTRQKVGPIILIL